MKCALSEYGLENNIGFNLLSFNIETAFANESPDLSFISRQLKPELTNLYGDFEQLHQLIQISLKLALNHEEISEGEKLGLILDLLKLSIKELKEPSELHLENLRLCVEHALDHYKTNLLLNLLKSSDIYRSKEDHLPIVRLVYRDIITSSIYKDKAILLQEIKQTLQKTFSLHGVLFDFCNFEYTKPSCGHTLLSIALIVDNQTAFNILANDQALVSKTLDNILNYKLKLDKQTKEKFSIELGKKARVCSFNKSLRDKIRESMFISESSSEQKDAFPRSLSSSSLMKSESSSDDSADEGTIGTGAAAAMAPAEVHRPKVAFAGVFPAVPFSIFTERQKPKPVQKEQPSEKKGSIFSKRKLTEDEQKKKDDRQFNAAMPNYDDL